MVMTEAREEQLKAIFAVDAVSWQPPLVREYGLQQMAQEREQRRLLVAVSVLSCFWGLLAVLAAVVLLQQVWIWGVRLLLILAISLLSAGLLTAALLRTEQSIKQKMI